MAMPNLVKFDDGRLLTRNLAPGQRVYDEELHTVQGSEHRTWNPMKSKLGSYLVKGGRNLDLQANSVVMYLGAANGTTPSHVSDIVSDGVLVAVEFSPRSFRDLLRVAEPRPNMVPVLADAWRPELYERYVGKVDLLFQDISQRQQGAIFSKNILRFKPTLAIIAVKARSVNVAANPRDVYQAIAEEVSATTGYEVVEVVDLGPYERDHAAIVLRPGSGKPKPTQRADPRSRSEGDAASRGRGGEREMPRDERPRYDRGPPRGGGYGGGGGYQRRDDRPSGGGGGWQRPAPRDDRPRGGGGGYGGGGGSYQKRDSPPPRSGGPADPPSRGERRDRDDRAPPPSDDRRRKWK
ncbi:MAG TPA: fibrillarin-like rRNA/tRNA 2'-O-methyltransferase [Candidatus Thermoplasmatota archaeon]|nr:fibrillarin-like rRNA/tRNA 2'-O-methyltransferase [Candidatus Thermoplasmatota archaeon]